MGRAFGEELGIVRELDFGKTDGFQITKRGNKQPTSLRTTVYKKWKN